MKKLIAGLLALSALMFVTPAMARDGHWGRDYHHGHGYSHGGHYGSHTRFGLYVGLPLFWPSVSYYRPYYSYPYAYPYAYPSTQVIVERQPQVYVQREVAAAAPASSGYWYYCPDTQTYYPYAQTCPSTWLQVLPQSGPR